MKPIERKLQIAGLCVAVRDPYDSLAEIGRPFFSGREPDFTASVTPEDIAFERQKSRRECAFEGIPCPDYSERELAFTAVYRAIAGQLYRYDALVFHGSAVEVDGTACLFTAKSGTGKTTHTRLWLKNIPGTRVVNGDKPILRLIDGTPYVCGTPWMGKEQMGSNRMVPLRALCLLSRGAENTIESIPPRTAMPALLGQTYRPNDRIALARTVKLIEAVALSASLYRLYCNQEDDAALTAYRGIYHVSP